MQVKTSELIGAALDWAVASCEGATGIRRNVHRFNTAWIFDWPSKDGRTAITEYLSHFCPSASWTQGGPIIERERIDIQAKINSGSDYDEWLAIIGIGSKQRRRYGSTPLIAAMRCYVASKLGETVDIPEELL